MDSSFIPKELVGRDIYQILGLTFDDAGKDNIKNLIRKRYLKCALVVHPDKVEGGTRGSGTRESGKHGSSSNASKTDSFNTLKCAYEFLMNEQLRNKYNLYVAEQKTKKKKNGPIRGNISLSRSIDKRKLDAQQKQKLAFKTKLEAREREMARKGEGKNKWTTNAAEWAQGAKSRDPTASSYRNGKNNRKKKNAQQEAELREGNHLKKMKAQNEDFVRRHSAHPGQRNRQKDVREEEDGEERNRAIEIYLANYSHNVDLLQRYIEKKEFLTFFLDFNFQKYYLNKNEEETQSERRVGLFSFSHRSEAIRAYLHFKRNGQHIDSNFKLRLAVPCNEGGEVSSEGGGPQNGTAVNDTAAKDVAANGTAEDPAAKDNVDRMMSDMVDELDKMFSL
ncbi:hypothetical protein C922_03633 [Plasmodium inui San Antonio 1]|uniref:J domain-containing protein n=1 Tax=Plasmodium inui San Antonio 1 TaxID=1237626 RepID=W7A9T5_9APIC|nr:hypothetical protein C922_03633 [Plasmodium inui San Antonio 1]EUD65909.1 hypothetical protein C922_03633 [Plasmodium inui San Antonio 1]